MKLVLVVSVSIFSLISFKSQIAEANEQRCEMFKQAMDQCLSYKAPSKEEMDEINESVQGEVTGSSSGSSRAVEAQEKALKSISSQIGRCTRVRMGLKRSEELRRCPGNVGMEAALERKEEKLKKLEEEQIASIEKTKSIADSVSTPESKDDNEKYLNELARNREEFRVVSSGNDDSLNDLADNDFQVFEKNQKKRVKPSIYKSRNTKPQFMEVPKDQGATGTPIDSFKNYPKNYGHLPSPQQRQPHKNSFARHTKSYDNLNPTKPTGTENNFYKSNSSSAPFEGNRLANKLGNRLPAHSLVSGNSKRLPDNTQSLQKVALTQPQTNATKALAHKPDEKKEDTINLKNTPQQKNERAKNREVVVKVISESQLAQQQENNGPNYKRYDPFGNNSQQPSITVVELPKGTKNKKIDLTTEKKKNKENEETLAEGLAISPPLQASIANKPQPKTAPYRSTPQPMQKTSIESTYIHQEEPQPIESKSYASEKLTAEAYNELPKIDVSVEDTGGNKASKNSTAGEMKKTAQLWNFLWGDDEKNKKTDDPIENDLMVKTIEEPQSEAQVFKVEEESNYNSETQVADASTQEGSEEPGFFSKMATWVSDTLNSSKWFGTDKESNEEPEEERSIAYAKKDPVFEEQEDPSDVVVVDGNHDLQSKSLLELASQASTNGDDVTPGLNDVYEESPTLSPDFDIYGLTY